jgi:hypothetical protein
MTIRREKMTTNQRKNKIRKRKRLRNNNQRKIKQRKVLLRIIRNGRQHLMIMELIRMKLNQKGRECLEKPRKLLTLT